MLLSNLGLAYKRKGSYDKAIKYYKKALNINLKFYGDEHSDIAINYNNLGVAYRNKGAYDKAIEFYKRALSIDLKIYKVEHPYIAACYIILVKPIAAKANMTKQLNIRKGFKY
jgi:tetratricopeptide (TPR) repeat protein